MRITSSEQLLELLNLASSERVEDWLGQTIGSDVMRDDGYWHYVGNQRSNAGSIEASADEINPLVERIVNAMEAVIELQVLSTGKEPIRLLKKAC